MANLFGETKRRRRKRRVVTIKKRVYKKRKKTVTRKSKSSPGIFQSILKKGFHGTINSYKEKKALEKKKKLLEAKKEQLRNTLKKRISQVKTRHTFNLIKTFFKR